MLATDHALIDAAVRLYCRRHGMDPDVRGHVFVDPSGDRFVLLRTHYSCGGAHHAGLFRVDAGRLVAVDSHSFRGDATTVVGGTVYRSFMAAARALGTTGPTLRKWMDSPAYDPQAAWVRPARSSATRTPAALARRADRARLKAERDLAFRAAAARRRAEREERARATRSAS